MSSVALVFNIIFSCLITLIFLYRCGNYRRQHPITTGAVFISWSFSVLFVFLLPLDISLAAYRECINTKSTEIASTITDDDPNKNDSIVTLCPQPWSYVDSRSYEVLWRIIYWTSQCLTWLVLPFMQSICQTGEFYLKGKIRYAFRSNLFYYGSLLLIFGVLVIYVAINYNLNASNFKVTVIAASTTWGLFLLVLMLGYGLVQVPLNVYNHSRTFYMLSQVQFKLSQLYNEKIDIEERLESLVDEISKLCLQIKYNDPLRPCLEEIVKIIPEQYSNRVKLTMDDYEDYRTTTTTNLTDLPTEKQLIKLNRLLKKSKHIHHRVQASWIKMINEAFYLEDILNNEKNTNRIFVKQSPLTKSWLRQKLFDEHPKLEWYTFCVIRPWTLRLLGIGLGLLSIIVIWSEMTFFSTSPVLSIFAQCVNAARRHYDYFTIEIICYLSIAYLCLCAYYTIFHIRIFNYFYLSLYHLTDENSLIFAATFLCRLTAPLSYNFLGMIHMDQAMAITKQTHREETIFTTIMGRMNLIPIISNGFNFYFPMLICLLCVGTYFRLGSRCLHIFGVRQFFDDDNISAEYVEDGKNLMKRERRNFGGIDTMVNTTTATQRRDRRRELEEKYGLRSTTNNNVLRQENFTDVISETRQLKSESSTEEPLINLNNNQQTSSMFSGSSRRVAPPTNIFNDV
jgi:hypothetical protein